MIGWYVHHQGLGHLHRATAVSAAMDIPVVGLSSLPRPDHWRGDWVQLERDDDGEPVEVTAGGRLHWAPRGHAGLRGRMAALSGWIDRCRPDLLVSDVSVEVAVLGRLHGVPVVSLVLPGDRSDAAHRLGYDVSTGLVAAWPPGALGMVSGLTPDASERLLAVGGLSRFAPEAETPRSPGPPRVTLLQGGGGAGASPDAVEAARRQTPEWEWTTLGPGSWSDDPWQTIRRSDVLVTHAGQNAVAEVAAARRPAVVIPAERPHGEQHATARALAGGAWPVIVEQSWPEHGWAERLALAASLDGRTWRSWVDGDAEQRMARFLTATAAAGIPGRA